MISTRTLALATAGAGLLCSSVQAAQTTFGGSVTARGGYGNNVGLQQGQNATSALLGGTLQGVLTRSTGTASTSLSAQADATQGFNGNGLTDNYSIYLVQSKQFNPRLQMSGDIRYQDSYNPTPVYSTDARDLIPIGDILTLGTHTRQITGDLNAGYEFSSKDMFQLGATAGRSTFSTSGASSYTQYGGSLGYLRTLSASTRIGLQASVQHVSSSRFSSSSAKTIGLQLNQRISAIWNFTGGINAVLQNAEGGHFSSLGFNGSVCGTYPRWTVCILGSRLGAASGIGGLRIETQGGARLNYQLNELSSLSFELTYDLSNAKGVALATQRYADGALTYSRTITRRISAGFSGRYQKRSIDKFVTPFVTVPGSHTNSYNATFNVSYRFGRNG